MPIFSHLKIIMPRLVDNTLWSKRSFNLLSCEEKLLLMYFQSSPETNYYGCFELVTDRVISDRTGFETEIIPNIINLLMEKNYIIVVGDYVIVVNYFNQQFLSEKDNNKKGLENFLSRMPKNVVEAFRNQDNPEIWKPLTSPLQAPYKPLRLDKVIESNIIESKRNIKEKEIVDEIEVQTQDESLGGENLADFPKKDNFSLPAQEVGSEVKPKTKSRIKKIAIDPNSFKFEDEKINEFTAKYSTTVDCILEEQESWLLWQKEKKKPVYLAESSFKNWLNNAVSFGTLDQVAQQTQEQSIEDLRRILRLQTQLVIQDLSAQSQIDITDPNQLLEYRKSRLLTPNTAENIRSIFNISKWKIAQQNSEIKNN